MNWKDDGAHRRTPSGWPAITDSHPSFNGPKIHNKLSCVEVGQGAGQSVARASLVTASSFVS